MLKFYELAPSPNNVKIRLALGHKGIPFEATPIDPFDRSLAREVSGQDLTPVIADRGIVLTDSEAILQYLDANYPDTPRLMPRHREGRYACDDWKRRIDRDVARPWGAVFRYAIKVRDDLDQTARAAFVDAMRTLEQELGDRDSFHDDPEMAVCDLRVVEWAVYALPPENLVARIRLFSKFADCYGANADEFPNLRRLIGRWDTALG